jgi:hypothetical protein
VQNTTRPRAERGGRADRPHQRLRPADDLGRPRDQRQEQDPSPQLAGQVPQLPDVPLAEGAPRGIGEHRPAAERTAHLGGRGPQGAERPVLGCPKRRDRPRQVHGGAVGRPPLSDGDGGERRAFLILQHQVAGLGGHRLTRRGQRDRHWPRGPVGQLAPGPDRSQVSRTEVPGQRGQRTDGE